MRFLHTSDWHLGRTLHRADLRTAQAAFIDHLVETVHAERVDAVLVAGDVYDRAIPSLDAVELCEQAFVRLREAGAQVIVISGNHDSARRLGFGSRLMDRSGVFLRTQLSPDPVMVGDVPVYGLPFLDPPQLLEAVQTLSSFAPPHAVVLAHGWVAGGAVSDSERDITVGGLGAIAPSLFDGFAYTALGHLHGPQTLREGLRYSGSPLAYSFSEAHHNKGSWLVEADNTGLRSCTFVPAPTTRGLSTMRGELAALLSDPALEAQRADYLSVTLTDTARPEDGHARLAVRFPHILVLQHEPAELVRHEGSYAARVARRSDQQIAEAFVEHVRGTPAQPQEQALFDAAFAAVRESTA